MNIPIVLPGPVFDSCWLVVVEVDESDVVELLDEPDALVEDLLDLVV